MPNDLNYKRCLLFVFTMSKFALCVLIKLLQYGVKVQSFLIQTSILLKAGVSVYLTNSFIFQFRFLSRFRFLVCTFESFAHKLIHPT